jgi:hypothetical protein
MASASTGEASAALDFGIASADMGWQAEFKLVRLATPLKTSYERRLPTMAVKTTMAVTAARPNTMTVLCCKTPISLKRASAMNTIIRRLTTVQRRGDRPRNLLRTRAIMVQLPIYPLRNLVRAQP